MHNIKSSYRQGTRWSFFMHMPHLQIWRHYQELARKRNSTENRNDKRKAWIISTDYNKLNTSSKKIQPPNQIPEAVISVMDHSTMKRWLAQPSWSSLIQTLFLNYSPGAKWAMYILEGLFCLLFFLFSSCFLKDFHLETLVLAAYTIAGNHSEKGQW